VFDGARQHVPSKTVCDLVALLRDVKADSLVSFGGGSPIDTAKAAAHALLTDARGGAAVPLVHVAVPTTLSAGEFTAIAGVTDEATRIKHAVSDPRLAPRTIVADPTMTLETPDWLWSATGMRSMDHAVETIYSPRHHPFGDALATKALALLVEHLPASLGKGESALEHRGGCQVAAWLSMFGLPNAGLGLSHALGHQIGPRWEVPHGVTSCITLPHAMRFMAGHAADRFGPIASGLGVPFHAGDPERGAMACADRMAAFIESLGLPHRLAEVQVPFGELEEVAATVHGAMAQARALDRPVTRAELAALLGRAY
jgi:alcohol dehydrogenase